MRVGEIVLPFEMNAGLSSVRAKAIRLARVVLVAGLACVGAVATVPGSAQADRPLVFAVHPYLSHGEILARFGPLAEHLGAALGHDIKVSVAKDYDHHIQMVGEGQVDMAYLGPVSYVRLAERFGPQHTLARQVDSGRPFFKGAIIVREDSPLQSLSELKGKRFAFGDPNSTMSHVVPLVMLHDAGVNVDDLSQHDFVGGHKDVALEVLAGNFDAGGVKDEILQTYEGRGIRALAMSEAFSEHLFVAGAHLAPDLRQKARAAFLSLHESEAGRAALQSIKATLTGMASVTDDDYETLRRTMKTFDRITAGNFAFSLPLLADLGIQQNQE